jgi:hypothetical protein
MLRIRRVRLRKDGTIELRLTAAEQDLLRSLPRQVVALLDEGDDPATKRLAPIAYTDDPEAEADFEAMVGSDLRDRHREALQALAETAGSRTLAPEQADVWVRALNAVRLVLAERLDIQEDTVVPPPGSDVHLFAVYAFLSQLQALLVDALATGLPE